MNDSIDISKDQAKGILDFLAAKAGIKFMIECDRLYACRNDSTLAYCIRAVSHLPPYMYSHIDARYDDDSDVHVIKRLLMKSSQGNDIIVSDSDGNVIMILPEHSTLEQLLIEMDLDVKHGCWKEKEMGT